MVGLQGWRRIARAVNTDPVVAHRIIYDVLNEPDAFGVRFEKTAQRPVMKDLYLQVFDAIYDINPGMPSPSFPQRLQCNLPSNWVCPTVLHNITAMSALPDSRLP